MNKQELHAKFGPKLIGSLPGPKAKAAVEADDRLISPSYTRSYPLVAKRGRGFRVEDVDGNEFLDFAAGIAVTSTGHCHPEVVAAIQKQAAELIHISGTDFYNEPLTDLAEQLSAIAPMPGPHRFFYGNSGAEAIECALKLARYHTGRQHIIAFLGAFHGRTMGALSLTGIEAAAEAPFFAAGSGRDPRALSLCVSRMHGRPAGRRSFQPGLRALHRGEAVQDDSAAGRSGGDLRRADPGRRRLRRCARQLPARAARASATGTASCWSSDEVQCGRGTHRQVVGDRALGRAAGHRLHGEGHCERHAAGRLHDAAPRSWTGFPARMRRRLAEIRFPLQRRSRRSTSSSARRSPTPRTVGGKMLERLQGWKTSHARSAMCAGAA